MYPFMTVRVSLIYEFMVPYNLKECPDVMKPLFADLIYDLATLYWVRTIQASTFS